MKRQVITIQEDMVIYAPHHGEVWMTVWEIEEYHQAHLETKCAERFPAFSIRQT